MQNLDVEDAIHKNRKTKAEIKKELEESIINGKSNENTEILEKVNNFTTSEDAAKIIQELEWPTVKDKYFRSLKKKNGL